MISEQQRNIERQRIEAMRKLLDNPHLTPNEVARFQQGIKEAENYLNTPDQPETEENLEGLIKLRSKRWKAVRMIEREIERLNDEIISKEYGARASVLKTEIRDLENKIRNLDANFVIPPLEINATEEQEFENMMLEKTIEAEQQTLKSILVWKAREV